MNTTACHPGAWPGAGGSSGAPSFTAVHQRAPLPERRPWRGRGRARPAARLVIEPRTPRFSNGRVWGRLSRATGQQHEAKRRLELGSATVVEPAVQAASGSCGSPRLGFPAYAVIHARITNGSAPSARIASSAHSNARRARTGAGMNAAPAITRTKAITRPIMAGAPIPIGSRKTRMPPRIAGGWRHRR